MKHTNKINICEHNTSTRIRTLLIWLHLPVCPSPGPYACLPARGSHYPEFCIYYFLSVFKRVALLVLCVYMYMSTNFTYYLLLLVFEPYDNGVILYVDFFPTTNNML